MFLKKIYMTIYLIVKVGLPYNFCDYHLLLGYNDKTMARFISLHFM